MIIITQGRKLRENLVPVHEKRLQVGLVPTMGALHEGHLSLVRKAREHCQYVVVSIFVNPKQFGPDEDYQQYPRDLKRDCQLLAKEKVDVVFAPSVDDMWPAGNETIVETVNLANILTGKIRPGHFRGVATVVAKLFNLVQPQKAFFGEKDFQQLAIIRRMVKDLAFPVEIIGVPILREPDGLAASSRNIYLDDQQRSAALVLYQSLQDAREAYGRGERSIENLYQIMRRRLSSEPMGVVEEIEFRDMESLDAIGGKITKPVVILLTFRFGQTRLIDQIQLF